MPDRTVLHGHEQSGLTADRPTNAADGFNYFDETTKENVTRDDTDSAYYSNLKMAQFDYNFADDGGVIGDIILAEGVIPDNAVIVGGMIDVVTTLTSAGDTATIAIKVEGANDIVTAVAINDGSNPWDAGQQSVIPDNTAAKAVKTTAKRTVTATVAVQALTAGRFTGFLSYYVSK